MDKRSATEILINQGLRQGCNTSSVLFNLHIDETFKIWKH